jgi:hypothetical protein
MDTIQAMLGQALLVLVALAVLMFALILLLLEADYLLRLAGRLASRWKSGRLQPTRAYADQDGAERPSNGQEA